MHNVILVCIWYFLGISMLSAVVTCYDKWAAKKRPGHRVPEKTLLLLAALGGSVGMYLTMLIIRHKTRHRKFMLGIPGILAAQLLLLWGVFRIGGIIK